MDINELTIDQNLLERINPVFNTAKMTLFQLSAAGDQDAVHTGCLEGFQHTLGAWHHGSLTQLFEIPCLHAIEGARFIIGNVLAGSALELHLDDFGACHALHLIELVTGTLDAVLFHEFHPGLGVQFHRVIEYTVAVDECGENVEAFVTCILQVLGDSLL